MASQHLRAATAAAVMVLSCAGLAAAQQVPVLTVTRSNWDGIEVTATTVGLELEPVQTPAGEFIREDDIRFPDNRPGHRDPLAFSP